MYTPGMGCRPVYLHHHVLGLSVIPKGRAVAHLNGDRLDNRKANLRLTSRAAVTWVFRRKRAGGASRYLGVSSARSNGAKCWRAQVSVLGQGLGGRTEYLGQFASEEEAARAVDEYVRAQHGEFARLNFPPKGERPAAPPPAHPACKSH